MIKKTDITAVAVLSLVFMLAGLALLWAVDWKIAAGAFLLHWSAGMSESVREARAKWPR